MDAGEGEDPTAYQRRPEMPTWSSSEAGRQTHQMEKLTY
jgi:hypothetical protein